MKHASTVIQTANEPLLNAAQSALLREAAVRASIEGDATQNELWQEQGERLQALLASRAHRDGELLGCRLLYQLRASKQRQDWLGYEPGPKPEELVAALTHSADDPCGLYVLSVVAPECAHEPGSLAAFQRNAWRQRDYADEPHRPSALPEVDRVDASGLALRYRFVPGEDAARGPAGQWREDYVRKGIARICEALAFLHARGVTHGALTPENILFGSHRPCLLDLTSGYHKDIAPYWKPQLACEYLAPEQNARSSAPPEPTSDVYAVGQLLYYLLSGRRPLPQACGDAWPRQLRDSTLSRRDKRLIACCIQSDPAHRPQSMEELLAELERRELTLQVPEGALMRALQTLLDRLFRSLL